MAKIHSGACNLTVVDVLCGGANSENPSTDFVFHMQFFISLLIHDDGEAKSRCVEWPVGEGEWRSVAFGSVSQNMAAASHLYGRRQSFVAISRSQSFVSHFSGCRR